MNLPGWVVLAIGILAIVATLYLVGIRFDLSVR